MSFAKTVAGLSLMCVLPLLAAQTKEIPEWCKPLPRPDPATDLGEGPHLGYAIQWFAFALILLAGYLTITYQRVRRGASAAGAVEEPADPRQP